jgi:hypothetical protein
MMEEVVEELREAVKRARGARGGFYVELDETLIEDLPENMDWDLYDELLHKHIPEALRDLLQEAGITAALYHLKDDVQLPEYIAEGIAEVDGERVPVVLLLEVDVDCESGEATLLGATVYKGELAEGILPYYHLV